VDDAVRCACIDVGSNTTRLLVADIVPGGIQDVANERVFTLIGQSLGNSGRIPPAKLQETAAVVAEQAARARELGADRIRAVATAAIRRAKNARELADVIERDAALALEVLDGEEEARLAFRGAARAAGVEGDLAVIDVGGGSTEIAVGSARGGVSEVASIPVGSSVLADAYLSRDPPTTPELEAVRDAVARAFHGYEPRAVEHAVAVGGSASSLLHLSGARLGPTELARALDALCAEPAESLGARVGLDPMRVRLLPAGVLVLAELAARLRQPLRICRGGLREGVIMEMIETAK
jgi:exopolyphosphatase / guanosine-5'-triphosphate,3'-diphosphate pyrophosphatase